MDTRSDSAGDLASTAQASPPQVNATKPPDSPEERQRRREAERHWIDRLRLVVQFLTLLATIGGLYFVAREANDLGTEVEQVGRSLQSNTFIITAPRNDERVNLDVVVRGQTPFVGMHHYIVVTAGTGDAFVQPGEATVSQAGTFKGQARLGEAGAGGGEAFTLRVLATKDALSEGPLTRVPDDALFSSSVTVVRNP
jgi:hypothetical protein